MENNSHFVKNGNVITPKPVGSDYNLKAGNVYRLVEDKFTYMLYLVEDKAFEINVVSYDNIIIFGEEVKNNPNDSFESIINDLNVEKK